MRVVIDGWAWLPKAELTEMQLEALRYALTIYPRKIGDHPGDKPEPIKLFVENDEHIGVPRDFFLRNRKPLHEIDWRYSEGGLLPTPLTFSGTLRPEQERAVSHVYNAFMAGEKYGGLVRAVPGWGKTVAACALMGRLGVPALVVVHKEFLVNQWVERINQYLPDAKVGIVQQDVCDYQGKHIAVGMVHSLAARTYDEAFYRWPGVVIVDECHRMGASTWAPVPPRFAARWRVGFSATPKRKDGADNAFLYHLGEILYASEEKRMTPKVRRVYSDFRVVATPNLNPNFLTMGMMLKFLCANDARNRMIVDRMMMALEAGRKVIVLSERLNHLNRLDQLLRKTWSKGTCPTIGYYVGGMSEEALDESAEKQCIFATYQFAAEGLDIPALDTLFLASPRSDVEQAVGRILRPCEGKKEPVVVDIRDDKVTRFAKMAESRDKLYKRMGVC